MIKKLMFFFRINKELNDQVNILQQTMYSLQGEIYTLKEWNKSLQLERKELQEIIYRRFGLTKEVVPQEPSNMEAVRKSRNWNDLKAELEEKHRQPKELTEQEKHWKEKIEAQEKVV